MIKCIKVDPGKAPFQSEIDNTLKAMQDYVGGYIEAFTTKSGLVVILNEEGWRTPGLRLNGGLPGLDARLTTPIVGNALIVRSDGEEFSSVADEDIYTVISAWERW